MGNTPSHSSVEYNSLFNISKFSFNVLYSFFNFWFSSTSTTSKSVLSLLYSTKLEVKKLNEELYESKNENIKLNEELKNVNYLNEVLEIKTKSQINENNKLKKKYDNLEYVKLDIEEKYLDLLDNTDSIDYLKEENNKLDKDLKKQIIKYNDEKNINRILGESLDDMTKQYTKFKQLYTQNCIESNTLKSSNHQYKKNMIIY